MTGSITIPYLSVFVASQKFILGDWYVIPHEGRIFNRFHAEVKGTLSNGYRVIGTKWNGMAVGIMHHRAVWIGANGGRVPEEPTNRLTTSTATKPTTGSQIFGWCPPWRTAGTRTRRAVLAVVRITTGRNSRTDRQRRSGGGGGKRDTSRRDAAG